MREDGTKGASGFGLSNWMSVPFTETVKKPEEKDDLCLGCIETGISGI